VVTKDDDFVLSFLITGRPEKLLLVSTGNIANSVLERIVREHVHEIAEAFVTASFVELGCDALTVHE
jgi:predicted nuclease of predicted toxin-antitoxin system